MIEEPLCACKVGDYIRVPRLSRVWTGLDLTGPEQGEFHSVLFNWEGKQARKKNQGKGIQEQACYKACQMGSFGARRSRSRRSRKMYGRKEYSE